MENKKAPMGLMGLLILIIFMAAIIGGLVYLFANYNVQIMSKNEPSKVVGTENNEEVKESKTEEIEEDNKLNESVTVQKIAEISSYIEKIYPKKGMYSGIPKFEKIENADKEWIWSVVLKNVADEKNGDIVFKEEAEKDATDLFGKNVGEFPGENEELSIGKRDDGYYWFGDQMSIPDTSKYIIKSIVAKENGYEVEIIEYLVHDWADGIWIGNLESEKIKTIIENEEDFSSYQIINSEIKKYVENNMEKFDSKVLTIEYNENEGTYYIISVK